MKLIIIDSSHQLRYTGTFSGRKQELETLFAKMEKIFRENNVANKYHYSKLSRKTREKVRGPLIRALEEAQGAQLNIFAHRKPKDIERKEWFIRNLPARIAQRVEGWLVGKRGEVEIVIDDDYNVIKGGRGTEQFARTLLRQISVRLTSKEATLRAEDAIRMTIGQPNGEKMTVSASISIRGSLWIGLIDIYLGAYIDQPKLFSHLKNVHYHEL